MSRHSRAGSRVALALGASLVSLPLAGCLTAQTVHHGFLINEAQLQQVPVGASQDQVVLALGTPSTTSAVPETGQVYYYISQTERTPVRFMRPQVVDQKVVAVYFDKGKRVTRLAQYGLKDGKVFDFVSRTTPTGGREMTFLTQLMKGATAGIPLPTSKSSSDPFGQ